jgi:ankyrin repeat protein
MKKYTLILSAILALLCASSAFSEEQFMFAVGDGKSPAPANKPVTSNPANSSNNNNIPNASNSTAVFESEKPDTQKADEIEMNKGSNDVLFVQDDNKATPPPVDYSHNFAVLVQSKDKDYDEIEEKLKNGQPVNQALGTGPYSDGNTMLHVAASYGDLKLANLALQYKANVQSTNKQGDIPLDWAVTTSNMDMINVLLSHSKDPASDINRPNKLKRNALHFAVLYHAKPEVINFLISNHANITAQDDQGETPVHYAAVLGEWDLLDALLTHGGNMMIKDNDGDTPEDLFMLHADIHAMVYFYPRLARKTQQIIKDRVGSDYTYHLPDDNDKTVSTTNVNNNNFHSLINSNSAQDKSSTPYNNSIGVADKK